MREWLSDSATWETVDVAESAADALEAERDRRGLPAETDDAA